MQISRALRFGLVGGIGFLVDAGTLLLVAPLCGLYLGRAASFATAVIVTWLLNRSFTFRDRGATRPHVELARYFVAMLGGGAVNWSIFALLMLGLPQGGPWPILAVGAGSLAGMVVNLVAAQRYVFRIDAR